MNFYRNVTELFSKLDVLEILTEMSLDELIDKLKAGWTLKPPRKTMTVEEFVKLCEEMEDERMSNYDYLIKDLDEVMEKNRESRRETNDMLNRVRGILTRQNTVEYERGLEDIWDALKLIVSCDVYAIFPEIQEREAARLDYFVPFMLRNYSPREIIKRVKDFREKKDCEPAVGDIVHIVYDEDSSVNGMLIKLDDFSCLLVDESQTFRKIYRDRIKLMYHIGKRVNIKEIVGGLG